RAPMPNLIPTSLSLWAGIYNVIFAFRAGAAVIIMDRFDTKSFAGFVERFQLRSTVLPPAAMTMLADDESITSLAPLKYVRSDAGDDMDGRLVDGWFHTGDLGRVDDEGFLWIEGRVSDMINRGGLKVFPEEVAEVIRLSPDVAECAVAGMPDDRLGEVPWAF